MYSLKILMEVWQILNDFKKTLQEKAHIVEDALSLHLPKKEDYPQKLHEAMHYSVMAGGKRLRPIMVMEAANLFKMPYKKVLPTACAMEMIHTYSLIHDDLPVMDNDDFRRGKPTCHKVYGEAVALLAGDALLTYAFTTMAKNSLIPGIDQKAIIDVIEKVSTASSGYGMIGGQTIDITTVGKRIDKDTLFYISNHKTGCLISVSLWAGARLANASPEDLKRIKTFGEKIGLIFQIVDDILDIKGDEKLLGKPVGSDEKNKKNTFPFVYGYDESIKLVKTLSSEAKELISEYQNSDFFVKLTDFLVDRNF